MAAHDWKATSTSKSNYESAQRSSLSQIHSSFG
jgi:hypothetical protein